MTMVCCVLRVMRLVSTVNPYQIRPTPSLGNYQGRQFPFIPSSQHSSTTNNTTFLILTTSSSVATITITITITIITTYIASRLITGRLTN
ncbi:hypothetical protein TWF128_001886 [Orbilia oligospora]|nr:hypothetical protein TWF128_001886 [Orbilia oligospora]